MSNKLKVVITSNEIPQIAVDILKEHFTVVVSSYSGYDRNEDAEYLREVDSLIPGASAILLVTKHPVTTKLLDKTGPQLKIVATLSAGFEHCNVALLQARGIQLSTTPEVLSAAVAEVAVVLLLGVTRRLTENLQQVRDGAWEIRFTRVLGTDVRGSTVGVIGMGGIGQETVKRLAAFGVSRFLYTGHREKPEAAALKAQFVGLDDLLNESDFILLACPLNDETRHIINKTSIGKMKSNAVIINVGRGDLIDQEALYEALKNKQIHGAGLDVTTPEPLPKDNPLLTLPNVFILPHIGSATIRTRTEMAELAAKNIVLALQNKPLLTPVRK